MIIDFAMKVAVTLCPFGKESHHVMSCCAVQATLHKRV
jgi:hypothetical protein